MIAPLLAEFEKPTTKDFVWPCWGPSVKLFGSEFCFNFIFFLMTLAVILTIGLLWLALRKPSLVPGRFQLVVEMGFQFVRETVVLQMIGSEGMTFFPLLAAFFFYIFAANILEVVPGINFTMNTRIAFPLVLALISWVVYNTVGIRRHGAWRYFKKVVLPPGIPRKPLVLWIVLRPLVGLIEFVSVIVFRPITLSVRLFANMVAGHFLLAVFFLGTIALITSASYLIAFGVLSGAMAVLFVGFEIFVSILQAFIFAVLTASYISEAMASEH
jgi:F-type H+-transporting ATPase subunit a